MIPLNTMSDGCSHDVARLDIFKVYVMQEISLLFYMKLSKSIKILCLTLQTLKFFTHLRGKSFCNTISFSDLFATITLKDVDTL